MPKFYSRMLLSSLLVAMLMGCGQKGPLYLPKSPSQPSAPEQAPPPRP